MTKLKNARLFSIISAVCSIPLIVGLINCIWNEYTDDILSTSITILGYFMLSWGLFKERLNNKLIIGSVVLSLGASSYLATYISEMTSFYMLTNSRWIHFWFCLFRTISFILMVVLVVVNTKDSLKNKRTVVNRLVLLPFGLCLIAFFLNIIFWNLKNDSIGMFKNMSFIRILVECDILWVLLDVIIVLGTSLWVVNKVNNQNSINYASCENNSEMVQVNSLEKTKNSNVFIADEIKKYKELLDMGAITQEEFESKKKELLNI